MSDAEAAEEPPEDDGVDEPVQREQPDYGDGMQKDVFRNVYGHNGAKAFVSAALRNGDTHILLEGPPGSGKSVFLLALESNVPGTIYRDGDQITASKLRDVLKDDPPILLVDEIDALDNDAYDVLSTPMEHGRLVRDSARESYDVDVGTQVVAACNHADELPEHIRNRFRKQEFEKYTEEEFFDLCEKMLAAEVGWITSEQEARQAAKKIHEITGEADPRSTRDVAQMASSLDSIDTLATAMHDPDADIEHQPLYPGEIKRAKDEVGKYHLTKTLAQEMVDEAEAPEEPAAEVPDEEAEEIEGEIEEAAETAVEEAAAESG